MPSAQVRSAAALDADADERSWRVGCSSKVGTFLQPADPIVGKRLPESRFVRTRQFVYFPLLFPAHLYWLPGGELDYECPVGSAGRGIDDLVDEPAYHPSKGRP